MLTLMSVRLFLANPEPCGLGAVNACSDWAGGAGTGTAQKLFLQSEMQTNWNCYFDLTVLCLEVVLCRNEFRDEKVEDDEQDDEEKDDVDTVETV